MRLQVLLLLTMVSCSSAVVMAVELPDQATAIKAIIRLGGSVEPDNASPSQTGISVFCGGCREFDDKCIQL
jgi:hypothetical protein